jgi:hypothetical protein
MSKLEKYYQVMPENFNDDLADSLMKAFDSLESVDVKDEIPTLQHELWQRGYLIAPRPEQVLESKVMWFVLLEVIDDAENELLDTLQEYNHSVLSNLKELSDFINQLFATNFKINVTFLGPLEESNFVKIEVEDLVNINCYRVK